MEPELGVLDTGGGRVMAPGCGELGIRDTGDLYDMAMIPANVRR